MSVEFDLMIQLIEKFSKFRNEQSYVKEDLTPYSVFGDFALYLQEHITDKSISQAELEEAFHFFNKLAESKDNKVLNLLVVGVFEVFTDDKVSVELARIKLSDKGRKLFEKTINGWCE